MQLHNLQSICHTLTSNKAAERKRAAEELICLLEQEHEVVKTLEINSLAANSRNLFTWTDVFAAEEIYFEKETEKIHQNPQSVPQSKAQVLNVIVKTVKKSTGDNCPVPNILPELKCFFEFLDQPFLPWFRIFNFITKYLEQPVYADIFGYSLTSMMISFLNQPLYVTLVQASSWSELIQLLLNMYGRHNIPVTTILECLNTAIRHGSDHPSVLSLLRTDVIPFYQKAFEAPDKVKPYLTQYLKGLNVLCQKNAVDFRGILCKLGEFIVPKILHSSCFNQDEVNVVTAEFLTVQLQLHSPCDVKLSSPGFYAADSAKWFEIVEYIYTFCIDSIEDIAKKKNSIFNKELSIPDNLLLLAVKCTNQITQEPGYEHDADGERPSKKSMTHKSFYSILDEISKMQPSHGQIIWISYIAAVLSEFPNLILSSANYTTLVSVGSALLNSVYGGLEDVSTFYRSLFICEKYLISQGLIYKHSVGTWDAVWNSSLKHLTTTVHKPETAELLRCLLVEVQPSNINLLLLSYVNRSLPVTKWTLLLLAEYLSRCALPMVVSVSSDEGENKTVCPRIALTRWLIGKLDETESCLLPLIGSILVSLLVKRSHVLLRAEYNKKELFNFYRPYMIGQEDFEKKLLKVAFVDPTPKIKIKTVDDAPTKWGTFKIVNNVAYHLNQSLQEDFETSLIFPSHFDKSSSDFSRKLFLVQNRLVLQLNLVNMLQKYGIGINPDDLQFFKKNMETLFGNFFSRFTIVFLEFFNREGFKEADQLSAILQNMRKVLQSCHLCEQTKVFFAQQFPHEVEEIFKLTFRNGLHKVMESAENRRRNSTFFEDSQSQSFSVNTDVDSDRTSNEIAQHKKASMEALNCLIDYALICDNRSAILGEIFVDCLAEEFELGNQFIFDLSSELVTRIAPILSLPSMSEIVAPVMKVLQNLCRGFYLHPRCVLRLWELCAAVAGPIANASDENKKHLMTLIGGLSTFLSGNLPNGTHVKIQIAAFKLFNELLKHDRDLSWTVYMPRNSEQPIWVLKDAYLHLNNPSHQVRICVADTICNIFLFAAPSTNLKLLTDSQLSIISECNQPDDHLGVERKILYEKLFPFIMETFFNIPVSTLRADERIEESVNRTSIALFCLSRLIFAYPLIKKKSLASLFAMIHRKGIKVELACRALKQANPNATKALCSHFSYVFNKWLALSNPVKDFPHQLFEYNNQTEFYRKFKREICVQLFEHNNINSLMDFAKQISVPHVEIITECYGILTARLTPSLALNGSKHVKPTGVNDVHGRLMSILGGKSVTDKMMSTYLGDIVLHLVSLCFNATVTSGWGCPSIKLPEPEVPYCSESEILECLDFLRETCTGQTASIISYLACTTPKSIYNILVSFASRIHEAHDLLEKFWRLHHFSMFINLLRQEPCHIFQEMQEYVCHFVIHAYLRLLKGEDNKNSYFVRSVLFLLSDFIQFLVQDCISEMKMYMYHVVSSLVSLSMKYPHHLSIVKKLLDILILSPNLIECIVSLDPFPVQIPEFSDYRSIYTEKKYGNRRDEWTMQRELQSCLDEVNASSGRCTKERLEFIKDLLANRKRDFEKLLRDMEEKRLVESNATEMIHRLIQMLVDVVLKSEDETLVREACRCLGEIGPLDLGVLVLPQYTSTTKISSMINAISAIIEIVAGYLTNDDINLVVIAGQVLASLLEVTECANILSEDIKTSEAKTRLGLLLKPFLSENPTARSPGQVVDRLLESNLNLNEINEYVDYPSWIAKLTCGLIECIRPEGSLSDRLMPLCLHKIEFCEEVLPFIVFVVLYAGKTNPNVRHHLSTYFRNFFGKGIQHLFGSMDFTRSVSPSFTTGGSKLEVPIFVNKLALRSLLKVVNFLRQHTAPLEPKDQVKPSPWENNFWLNLDYMELAKIAQYCGAYLTSILYVEISAVDLEMRGPVPASNDGSTQEEQFYSQNTSMYPRNRNDTAEIEKLLLKAYTKIGEEDAVYGCGSALFLDFQSSIKHLEQRQQWSRVLAAQDSDSGGVPNDLGICRPLKELGLYNSLWTYLEGVQVREKVNLGIPLSELQFECGWRLSKWTLNYDKAAYIKDSPLLEKRSAGTRFHKFIYESVQAGLAYDNLKHTESIQKGLESIVIDLKHASLESTENLYGYMSHFQLLRVVEDFFTNENDQWIDKLQYKWSVQDKIGSSNFKYLEPFLYLRAALLNSLNANLHKPKLSNGYTECMLELLAKARDAGRLELAENCAVALGSGEKSTRKELEVSKNHWARGEQSTATHMLRKLIRKNTPDTTDLFANMMLLYGDWLSETMLERPLVILKKFFIPGCGIMENHPGSSLKEVAKANFVVAKYADNLYQNVTRYMRSDLFLEKQKQVEASQYMDVQLNCADQDTRKSALIFRKQNSIEQDEIQTTKVEKKKFLLLALRHYLHGLSISNDNDLLVFRAVALWLENSIPLPSDESDQLDPAAETNKVFAEENLPTYKYIVVLHQLSARMGLSDAPINCLLNDILTKCAQEHPLHTIPILLTQSLLHKDQDLLGKSHKKQVEERVVAAAKIVESLKKDRSLSSLLIKMEKLWISLIHVANHKDTNDKNVDGQRKQFGPKTNLTAIKSLEAVAVPTIYVPVSPTGQYDGFVGISGFDSFYNLVGGINSPKRISCTGTNGIKYNMLLKGQDDLRQDAVMQQVFGVMNRLLLADSKTKTKRLTVRTYKVVPLSQRSGIIEWCENTQTFGDYLVGSDNEPGAHAIYRPNDYKAIECRKKMNEVKDCRDHLKKLRVYLDIAEKFKPVFRHFFFEKFKDAGTFFDRRLAYTRSVATTSMVGYILGLGDRHVLNILIDKTTAELIHIDLGVAFEQGRILPTPETIPFRLTRDMVDGMGVSGIEGVFRKSCELTLEVLRNNSEIILTILEVLLYDPLYIWTLTADRVQKVQPAEAIRNCEKKQLMTGTVEATVPVPDMRNNSAVRVLLRLRQKLAGIEEGCSSGSSLSVPGHVTLLVGRAMDPERLCRLFPGWQPYL